MGRKALIKTSICMLFMASFLLGLCTVPAYAIFDPPDPPSAPSAPSNPTTSDRDSESAVLSDMYKLKMITVNGKQMEGFDKDKQDYTYYMSSEEEAVLTASFTKAVAGTPFDILAEIVESVDGDKVTLYVNNNNDPNGLAYTVTFLKMVSKDGSGLIFRENRYLIEIMNAKMSANELKNRTVGSLKAIAAELKRIHDPEDAEKAYLELQDTLAALLPILDKVKTDPDVMQGISDMTEASRNLVRFISDNGRVADLTVGYFGKMSGVFKKADMSSPGGSSLKNSVQDLGAEAVHRTGTLKAGAGQITATGEKATVLFDSKAVASHLPKAKANYGKVSNAMSSLLGSNNPRRLEYGIALKADRGNQITSMEATLEKGILDSILKDRAEKLEMQMGEAALAVKPGILKADEKTLKFSAAYTPSSNLKLPGRTGILPGGFVADIALVSDVGSKESFETPALLTIDLSGVDLSGYSDKSLKGIGLYRLNEDSGNWMPVGGNYDPITRVIKVFRLHLSKYTALKTDKAFSDVQNSWAKDDINELLNKDVVKEEVAFAPKGELTREEFARWVAKAYGLEAGDKTLPFKDISKNHPYYNELAAAYSQGIINGRSPTAFDPNGKITRQEMATLITNVLVKYEKAKVDSTLSAKLMKYSDNKKVASWARDNVAMVNELGIMQGDSRGFRPTDYVSREEAASLFKRIYN